jgi:site-specific DNA recombinase
MTAPALISKRAVGYFRVSSPGQTGERHSSLETQEARFHEHCQRFNFLPVATFIDIVSGRRDDRKDYRRMVEYLLGGGADFIIVQFLDRFGRNPREILQRYWELQDRGVGIVATDEDIKEELLLLIKAGIAGAESRRTAERVKANMSRAVSKGVHAARAPYGLRRVYQGKEAHWELDPVEAPIVRQMYHLAVEENLGFKKIADRLSEQGYLARGGRPFASFTLQHILTNEALMGTLAYGKRPRKGNQPQEVVRVPGFFPAILTEAEWQRLGERLDIRKESARGHTHASVYLLSGIAKCGHCGEPMAGKVGAARHGKRYRNYWCSRALKSRSLCATYNGHAAPRFEQTILEYLSQFSDPEMVREHMAAAESRELEKREQELREVQQGLGELEAQFLKHLDLLKRGILNEQEFVKANESLRRQKGALEARREELSRWVEEQRNKVSLAERIPEAIRSFLEDFQGMEARLQKARLQTILKAAHIYRDSRIELEFRS